MSGKSFLASWMLLFFIIGIPMYLCGCAPAISSKCYKYTVVHGLVKYKITNTTCTQCSNPRCTQYTTVACFIPIVWAEFDEQGKQGQCEVSSLDNFVSYDTTLAYLQFTFPPGTTQKNYIDNISNECTSQLFVSSVMVAGLGFLNSCWLCWHVPRSCCFL